MKRLLLTTSIVASLAAPAAQAGPRILTGEVSEQRVAALTHQIQWYHSLAQAEQAARAQGKLVFWVHMLGNLDGAT